MFPDLIVQRVYAQQPPDSALTTVVQTTAAHPVAIDLGGLTVVMVVWILVICAVTQGVKYAYLTVGGRKGRRYRAACLLIPIIVGAFSGPFAAPGAAHALSFAVPLLPELLDDATSLVICVGGGFAAGMLATWTWDLFQKVIVPIILAVAPEAARQAIVKGFAIIRIDVEAAAAEATVARPGLEEITE